MLLCTFYTSSPDYVKHLLFYTSFTVHDVNVLGVPCPGCGIPHPPGSIGIVPSRRFAVVRFFCSSTHEVVGVARLHAKLL